MNDINTNISTSSSQPRVASSVSWWLLIGVIMVFFQVLVGGITRLTDSGLSITEWAVIQGTIPPLNEQEWISIKLLLRSNLNPYMLI